MNQILVNEKLYITPELKRKKKLYKFNFITSIILIVFLFGYYVYAEYDRNSADKSARPSHRPNDNTPFGRGFPSESSRLRGS